jgi:predicted TIM-barrel fold metal-dependent hydrolase
MRMAEPGIIDCHAHIIDHDRFPFADGPGYRPRRDERGPREAYGAVLDAHGVSHALLVQPSGYGFDNAAMLDAMAAAPGRYKAIAVADPAIGDRALADLAAAGVVGLRFNLVTHDPTALDGAAGERWLARLKALGWFVQIFAPDAQWPALGPRLARSGVAVLIDHFGIQDPTGGIGQAGFQAVLALGRTGRAVVKLSAPFRIARRADHADLDPFAAALLESFGLRNCIWGSDWPFLGLPPGLDYAGALAAAARWLPRPAERDQVLRRNPRRLFGFPE